MRAEGLRVVPLRKRRRLQTIKMFHLLRDDFESASVESWQKTNPEKWGLKWLL
jgi:hypothetical protein